MWIVPRKNSVFPAPDRFYSEVFRHVIYMQRKIKWGGEWARNRVCTKRTLYVRNNEFNVLVF